MNLHADLRHRLYRNIRRVLSDALGTETEYTVIQEPTT